MAPAAASAPTAVQNHQRPTTDRSRSETVCTAAGGARVSGGASAISATGAVTTGGGGRRLELGDLAFDLGPIGRVAVGGQVAPVKEHGTLGHPQTAVSLCDVVEERRVRLELVGAPVLGNGGFVAAARDRQTALLVVRAGGLLDRGRWGGATGSPPQHQGEQQRETVR